MLTNKKWYAVYTRPKWEKKVADMFTARKIENYCPFHTVQKQWSDRKKLALEPLFTSYVFVHAAIVEHPLVKQADGVINFVYWLGSPAVIRDEEINTIKMFLDKYNYVKLEMASVDINDRIMINGGPLSGNEGDVIEIKGKSVKVYLPSLGCQLLAEVEKTNITIINKFQMGRPIAS
jgi:transcription antitermination factor NusG